MKKLFAVLLLLICLWTCTALATSTGRPTAPTMKRGTVYANGIPLVITEGSTFDRTLIYYDDGTGNPDTARGALDLTSAMRGGSGNTTDGYTKCDRVTVYGGCERDSCPSAKITMRSGIIYEIRGGGSSGDVEGDVVINAIGGQSSYIRGGGGSGVVKGDVYINIQNHTVNFDVNGGGNPGKVNGNVSIDLSSFATVCASLYAGGWSEGVGGDVTITLSDWANVGFSSYGYGIYASTRSGDARKPITGNVRVIMKDNASVKALYGTNIYGSPVINGNLSIDMRDSANTMNLVAATGNGVINGNIILTLAQNAPTATVNKLKGAKGITGVNSRVVLGNGTDPFLINAAAITPGSYDTLLLRKNAVITLQSNDYATLYTDGTQQITLEEYTVGSRVLQIAVPPTDIAPSTVELFQIVQPAGTAGGTWYIDSTQTSDMGLLKKATTPVSTPVISPEEIISALPISVTLSCATSGATIRYTTDGSEPTSSSMKYTAPINVSANATVKAKGFKTGMIDSATARWDYVISPISLVPTDSIVQSQAPANLSLQVGNVGQVPSAGAFGSLDISTDGTNFSPVSDTSYSVTYGSIHIALKQDWLNTLAPGVYTLRVNLAGAFADTALSTRLTVTPLAVPVIVSPTGDTVVTVDIRGTASLSVQATGAVSYQWMLDRNDGTGFTPILNATGADYAALAETKAHGGYRYYCAVSNAGGTANSPIFTLNVVEPFSPPVTGDNARPLLWLACFCLSCILISVLFIQGARVKKH